MCGIAGFADPRFFLATDASEIANRMAQVLRHRGPDDGGVWCDPTVGLALAHRRLAILDLSPAGHQPMVSASGRWVIVFNGEIYNHTELRKRLELAHQAPAWRGHSDTETLLAAVEAWGVEATLQASVGMFALALWDCQEKTLYLARDRAGEKPLYYGWSRGVFLFGSELKALRAHPTRPEAVNRQALALYLRHGYVPGPYSIWQGISKLPPGTYLILSHSDLQAQRDPQPRVYWSLAATIEQACQRPFASSFHEAVERLTELLRQAVKQQMIADVPLGAFLSGGIDSSTVVALMQAESSRPVRSFTIGFHEASYDEAQHARAVAQHLGTEHTELYVSPDEARDVIPKLPELYDEPFADSSQIPTFLVAQLARRAVTVALSGDAGDELFGGYGRYQRAERWRCRLMHWPRSLRRCLAAALTAWTTSATPLSGSWLVDAHKLKKAAHVLRSPSPETIYWHMMSHWDGKELCGIVEPPSILTEPTCWTAAPTYQERLMAIDFQSYLVDDILVKVDRAAMGVSLETRVPLLDHRVIAFAWSLPLAYKIHRGIGKRVLRAVLHRFVPPALVERPKMGFGVPIDHWLRGPLRAWAEHLLTPTRLQAAGYVNPGPIRRFWTEHLNGRRNWQHHLWIVLMWEAWREAHGV